MRNLVAAGSFYPRDKEELILTLKELGLTRRIGKSRAILVPHAGITYSGRTAAKAYNQIRRAKKIVIVGTNHSGTGKVSASQQDWITPLGKAKTWKTTAFPVDETVHAHEHSIEIQLPFLQYKLKNFRFLPLSVSHLSLRECERTAQKIVKLKPCLVIASGDLSHCGPGFGDTKNYDPRTLELIKSGNPKDFYDYTKHSTVCGHTPITILLYYAQKLGLKPGLEHYSTSKDVTGDSTDWVGYTSFTFK
ncbi:MAG: AmmeMemoRadiSam system protein B [Nanoarchaeota archaeon]|nr:AmmeMemoRadiSam system protein B [Nanoarchaeota archaeon]